MFPPEALASVFDSFRAPIFHSMLSIYIEISEREHPRRVGHAKIHEKAASLYRDTRYIRENRE